jgi:hypothetical protein
VSEGQFDEFSDLGHLFPAATDIIISDLVEVTLLILTLDGFTFTVNNCVLSNDTVLGRVDLHHLKFYLPHATTHCEQVTLSHRAVGFTEVWSKENVEQGASETLDGVGDGKDGDPLGL